ncbi:bL21 family ribosomal protein [Candidatus Berkelbacteria bacterium]|nr:bL21 family ribosomal protein [Candidatus Berkelbacteria bacterium]
MAKSSSASVAVVSSGGFQHLVTQGATLDVPSRTEAVGTTITLRNELTKTSVTAIVVAHGRHPKVVGRLFHNKVRHSRYPRGHKQPYTRLTIKEIQ